MRKPKSLPPLPEVNGGREIALLVACILWAETSKGRKGVEMAQRTAQTILAVSSRDTINKRFKTAKDLGLLAIAAHSRRSADGMVIEGNRYRLGSAAIAERPAWVRLNRALFGNQGLVRPLFSSGLMVHRALGRDGRWLALGLLRQAAGDPVTAAEIHSRARGLLGSEELVSRHLDRFAGWGIATRHLSESDGRLRFSTAVTNDELRALSVANGWAHRYEMLKGRIEHDQHGTGLVAQRLTGMRCCYCGTDPGDPDNPITLEHLPPTHWTGNKRAGLLLPACLSCNSRIGSYLRGTTALAVGRVPPRLGFPNTADWDLLTELSDDQLCKSLLPSYVNLARRYRDSMLTEDLKAAEDAVRALAPLAEAVRGGTLELCNQATGEIRFVGMDESFAVWLADEMSTVLPRAAVLTQELRRELV